MSVFQVIAGNLLGFDMLIFVAAALNFVCFAYTRRYAAELYNRLNRMVYIPSHSRDMQELSRELSNMDEQELMALRKRSQSLYSIYINVSSIFPLLGILGTVVSLLPMVADMANMQLNFFSALTSTFWGLVFAIIFKLLDGFLSSRMEDNEKGLALLLSRRRDYEVAVL